MPIEKIIVLEDEAVVRKSLEQHLRGRGYDVAPASTLAAARSFLAKDNFDLIIADVRLPDGEGTELLRQLQGRAQRPLVVMMSALGSVETAVECMRNGAFDYLIKPFSNEQLEMTLKKTEEFTQLVKVNQYLSHSQDEVGGFELLGKSRAMEQLRQLIRKVAHTEATVLVQGESGTGKELVARALYSQGSRSNAPFIAINCAAVPENLIESEFFGHEKGAFTGAMTKRDGRFELAHGGTIFLDEVSEISPQVQAKLLRVLQERELQRVGGDRTIKVDVRVIASTNRRLQDSLERKEFREDLYFRLNVVPIVLPPLRHHLEDLPLLAKHFMQRFARKHGVKLAGITPDCLEAMQQHHWPGNVRELQNVIERAVILCPADGWLRAENLGLSQDTQTAPMHTPVPAGLGILSSPEPTAISPETKNDAPQNSPSLPESQPVLRTSPQATEPTSEVTDLPTVSTAREYLPPQQPLEVMSLDGRIPTLWEMERKLIFAALERCNDNRTHAAKLIGVSLRTLRNKLAEYRAADGVEPQAETEMAEAG